MLSVFEIISKDEFEKGSGGTLADRGETRSAALSSPNAAVSPGQLRLEWCEFCQEWYLAEYHFGRNGDD